MKKLMIAAATVALAAGGVALPAAASASASHPAANHHHKHHVKHHAKAHDVQRHPCNGLGIDIALGSQNICIPL